MLTEATTDLMRDVYRHVLGVTEVGPDDEFLGGLGGDSLSLADAVSCVFELLGVDIMDAMAMNTSAAAVGRYLERAVVATAHRPLRTPPVTLPPHLVSAAAKVRELAAAQAIA